MKNLTCIDRGALQMTLNVLERMGKEEIAKELRGTVVTLEELVKPDESEIDDIYRIIETPRSRPLPGVVEKYGYYSKFSSLWMSHAIRNSKESTAERRNVGCAIVTKTGGIYSGYNGTTPGASNCCESDNVSIPDVEHAEENALDKMHLDRVSPEGALIYLTDSPCFRCARRIAKLNVGGVFYLNEYRLTDGIDHLNNNNTPCVDIRTLFFPS